MIEFLKFGICSLSVSGLFLGLNQISVSAFTLDLFTDANNEPVTNIKRQRVIIDPILSSTGSDTDINLSGTDLGQRTLDLTVSPFSSDGATMQVLSHGINGTYTGSVSSNSEVTIDSAKFTWGSDSTSPQDITNSGNDDSFLIDIIGFDDQESLGATFTFSVEDSDGDIGLISKEIFSTGNTYFPFETLSTNFSDVNQTAIREVSLNITNAPVNFDTTFDLIESAVQPVPFEFSPSLGLIFCGGLFGMHKIKNRLTAPKA